MVRARCSGDIWNLANPVVQVSVAEPLRFFSGGYREDALECMEKLVQKYGKEEEEEDDDDSDLS